MRRPHNGLIYLAPDVLRLDSTFPRHRLSQVRKRRLLYLLARLRRFLRRFSKRRP